jgi:altronate dehydratase large subunit
VEILGPNAARAIAPGNIAGGMTTIQEKSLGCIRKGGTVPLSEVVAYGQKPTRSGLIVMDGPGYDGESLSGLTMMGCQIMTFSTGRGTPMGVPVMPVIKLASNDQLYARMEDDMDFNAGRLVSTNMTFEEAGDELIDLFLRVVNGEPTKAEKNDQNGVVCLYTYSAPF